jgi:hypothetical protein
MASPESAIARSRLARPVLGDEGGVDAHVPHTAHQFSRGRARDRREVVAGMLPPRGYQHS